MVADILISNRQDKKPFGNRGYSSLYTVGFNMCSCANTPDRSEARHLPTLGVSSPPPRAAGLTCPALRPSTTGSTNPWRGS